MSIGGGSDDLSPQQLMEAANNWAKRNAFSPEQLQVLCVVMVYGWKMDFNTPHRCSYTSNALTHTHVRTHTHTHKRTYTHTHTYARQTHRTRGATPDPVHVTHTHECAGIHTPQHDGGGLVTHCNTLQRTATYCNRSSGISSQWWRPRTFRARKSPGSGSSTRALLA